MASRAFGTLLTTLTMLMLQCAVATAQTSWTTGAPLPVARYEAPSVALNGKVYVFGGFDTFAGEGAPLTATPQVHVYDPVANNWTQLASIPTAGGQGLTHHGIALDDDRFVWTAAGFLGNDPGVAISTVWKYDIALNSWTTGPSLPAARAAGGLVRVGRTLHYIGGVMADRDTDGNNHYVLNLDNPVGWTSAAPFPTPRNHFSTIVLNGKIYTIGGQRRHDTNPFDVADVEVYDPGSNSWSTAADSPIVRSHFEPGTFVRDGRIVAVGGQSGASTQIADITEYDPLTDTWSALTPLPVALRAAVAQSVGSKIVVAGGGAFNGYTPTTTTYIGAVPAANGSWSTLAPLNPGRAEVGVAAAGGKVYILGGISDDVLLNSVSVYDPVADTWSAIAPLPGPARDHVGAASVDDKIYAIGGLTNWPGPSFGGVYMYDPANPGAGWTTRASLPAARGAMGVGVINGKIYATGGLSGSVHVNDLTVYDPLANTWTTLAPMSTARDHLTASVVDGKLYAIGGRFTDIVPATGATEVGSPGTELEFAL